MPQKFIILAIITALFLVAIYFLVDSISIYLMAEKNRKEEQYDSIFKSEKSVLSFIEGKHLMICMNSLKKETSPESKCGGYYPRTESSSKGFHWKK